jgi:hypothetical protein
MRSSGRPVTVEGKWVPVIGDDRAVAGLVREILEEEGWRVAVLTDTTTEPVRAAVDRLEPDCILLDGAGRGDPRVAGRAGPLRERLRRLGRAAPDVRRGPGDSAAAPSSLFPRCSLAVLKRDPLSC